MMTNLAVIDQNTTLGISIGDLKGGLSATVLSVTPGPTSIDFKVQHHLVTDAGETITFDPVHVLGVPVETNLFGVFTPSPLHIQVQRSETRAGRGPASD